MTDLTWFELHLPRDLEVAAVTGLLRTVVNRPRRGLLRQTPVLVFEVWAVAGQVRWLLGVARPLVGSLPKQLLAQMPRLGMVERDDPERTALLLASDVRLSSISFPLRLDTAGAVSAGVLATLGGLGKQETAVLHWVIGPSHRRAMRPSEFDLGEVLGLREPASPSASEQQAWRQKAAEPLLGVRGRVGASAATPERATAIIRALVGALGLANSAHAEVRSSKATARRARDLAAAYRSGGTWSSIVSVAELAVLLGWPLGDQAIPGVHGPRLGQAPPPLLVSLETDPQRRGIRTLGISVHPADRGQLVTMPVKTSTHHTHLIGPTGSGKSHELAQLILADIHAGYGVFVVEPRGDLVADILARMPENRQNEVVVIDPAESGDEFVTGFNPLAGPRVDAERRADELVGLFRHLYGSSIGPRSADVLLHVLITVARLDDGTLADVPVLLGNPAFRRKVLARVTDPLVLGPWWAWFESTSDPEKQQIIAPINNKLRGFLSRQPIRRMLAQAYSPFTMDELFSKRRIVLVNLNRGVVGPEACRLLGSLLLSHFWAAAQRRASVPKHKRHPVMAVIDEFQEYIGALDFDAVLAQSRGLSLSITVAHQNIAQLTPSLQATVAANARSRLTFRPSQKDEKELAALLGHDVTPEDLARLGAFQAAARLWVDGALTPAFCFQTLPLPPAITNPDALWRASRARYGVDGNQLDADLADRWSGSSAPGGPVGIKRRGPA